MKQITAILLLLALEGCILIVSLSCIDLSNSSHVPRWSDATRSERERGQFVPDENYYRARTNGGVR